MDLRVLDLTTTLAGAYCTKLLADAGADVSKVEPPGGDPLRRWSASGSVGRDGEPDGALFRWLCTGKRIVDAELTADALLPLASSADVVVESFLPGVIEGLGLDLPDLQRGNTRVSLVSISPFGRGGPRSGEDASEFLLQARSGATHLHGLPGRAPLAIGGRLGEYAAGAFAAAGALLAQWAAHDRGRGLRVDVSLLESVALTLAGYPTLTANFPGGVRRRKVFVQVPSVEPCRDGYVGLFTVTGQQWLDFLAMIGRPELGEDTELASAFARSARSEEVRAIVEAWTREHTVAHVLDQAARFRVPAAPIGDGRSIPQLDQVWARRSVTTNPAGGFVQPRSPFLRTEGKAAAGPQTASAREPARVIDGSRPLAGVRVLDLTAFWAGPFAAGFLASMGADVVKVESIQRPDPMRFSAFVPPTTPHWHELAHLYHATNLGKRTVTLNLADDEGRDLFLRLLPRFDVVIENFTPRVMEHFRLTFADLLAVKPDVVFVRMPAFGLEGPWRDRPGFATTIEQAAGMATINGYADAPPMPPGGVCDPIAGIHAAFAVLVGLRARDRTGRGQQIEVPMIEVGLNLTAEQLIEFSAYDQLLTRDGNRGPLAAPQGVYACRGGEEWVAIAVGTDAQWERLRAALGQPAWAADPALDADEGRRKAHDVLDAELDAWCAARARDAVVDVLRAHDVPCEPVVPSWEIDRDPQLVARGFFQQIEHPYVGSHAYPGWPYLLFDGFGVWHRGRAPLFAEHTDEVLRDELGLTDEALAGLRDRQVIGELPLGLDHP